MNRHLVESDVELAYLSAGVVAQLSQPCPEDEYFDPSAGQCVPYQDDPGCPPGMVIDPMTDECTYPGCPSGAVYSSSMNSCVQCPDGWYWDESITSCQPSSEPGQALPPGFVAPGAVDVRPANWDLEAEPATYVLAWGDTYVGLAATYLGDGARWKEIWNLNRDQHQDPDKIYVSQTVNMPDEAADKMRRWLKGNRKELPGSLPDEPTITEKARSAAPWLVLGTLAAGGIYYAMS